MKNVVIYSEELDILNYFLEKRGNKNTPWVRTWLAYVQL